jgi:hypothetical protein
MCPARRRLVEATVRCRATADCALPAQGGKHRGRNSQSRVEGYQRAYRHTVARGFAGIRIYQRISRKPGPNGGVDHERRDGRNRRVPGRNSRCASPVARRARRSLSHNIGSRRSRLRLRLRSCFL